MKAHGKRDLRRYRARVINLAQRDLLETDIAWRLGLTVGEVRLILIAWLPR